MDILADFVPDACTLPTADRPLRLAEFATLFRTSARAVGRVSPTRLRLRLDDDPAVTATARDLAARESACCAFFTFTFGDGGELTVDVPPAHAAVLDGLERLAR
ncbi:hypothetical protein E1212_18780 [Jiangella ureilytica]|uniref:Arsenate reductase n=1 Tax=Jiangella ureilytica TaxID=2530374 RepID=A0A4V2XWG8_9ACTN|nr:hypothetical protein [Jiangella ureilytica]TDC49245.1 hypothetical protein E1212_18780 [Jiangella ureilytica]